ncbi:uncharacterized protein AB675_8344 [Cyphellophora attinorum]|uniref:Cyclochlorotine biosynthesis protein O n=1 Tax=Cyphellophora attinorum TaxID=1664694 RepID=A0A0N1H9G2_9EURO|nr:uncharacterized protein AB675_8344 [Phialophora attinorum]KPI44235.1 hypothetical protein AB675_8344 [Phialophora attinorum]
MSSRRPPAGPRSSSIYTQVRTEDDNDFIPGLHHNKGNSPLLWLAVVVLSLLLAGNAWHQGGLFNTRNPRGSYEKGFKTELVQTYIRLEEKRFHGAFRVDDQGYWHMSTNPDEQHMLESQVARWTMLGHSPARFYGHTAAEVQKLGLQADPEDYEPGLGYETPLFRTEPSTYHDLHCLDYVRKALDWEYYTDITVNRTAPEHPGHASHRLHLDHCIELMRQSFLCHMDLTPIPRRWLVNGNMMHADQDQVHMCRAREPFHDWIQEQPMERLISPV